MCAFLQENDVGAVDRDGARPRQQLGAAALGPLEQRASTDEIPTERFRTRDAEAGPGLLEDLAAERRPFVDDRDEEPCLRRLHRGGEARRATADHEDVVG